MRPGFLKGVDTYKPKYSDLGMLPPGMGPHIPGIPILSPFIFPHPQVSPRRVGRCSSCRRK